MFQGSQKKRNRGGGRRKKKKKEQKATKSKRESCLANLSLTRVALVQSRACIVLHIEK